jgi:uncharacterized protein YigE (DUF2233 family)
MRCVAFLAPWSLLAMTSAHAVECERVSVDGLKFIVCRADVARERVEVAYADAQGQRFGSFEALRKASARDGLTLKFAMNAGMFHPDFRAVGLLVVNGQALAPINRGSGYGNFFMQPNGVFMIDAEGARVLPTHEFRNQAPHFATQSGPMVLDRGMIPDTHAFRASSTSRTVRNGVCAPTPQQAAFVISESRVNFHEFARFFRDSLQCTDALFLDGTISSLYAPALKRADGHAALGPMIAIVEPRN